MFITSRNFFCRRIVQGVVHKHMHTQPKFGRLVDTGKKNQETVSKGGNLAAAEKVKKWRTKMAFSYSQVHFFALPKHHVICAAVSFFERIGRNGGRHGCLQPRHLTHLNYISVLFSYSLRLPLSIYRNFMRGTISQSWCLTAWNIP